MNEITRIYRGTHIYICIRTYIRTNIPACLHVATYVNKLPAAAGNQAISVHPFDASTEETAGCKDVYADITLRTSHIFAGDALSSVPPELFAQTACHKEPHSMHAINM